MPTDAGGGRRFDVRPTSDSHFAWLRTRMAADGVLMAWLRTAMTMIGFGFTIVLFFEQLKGLQGVRAGVHPGAPRFVGLALIATGTVALLVSAWQYLRLIDYLWSDDFRPIATDKRRITPVFALALFMALIGAMAFGAVYLRFI